ncbi:ThiF family adenylyltransferase [Corallococcus caeni]|uniref:ThiF family adenylyltransferase n=1 Tax=Corallococcus caeni TaxID=3082388 RepID=UPI0030C75C30
MKRLREEGYFVQIQGGFLIMREVPYVDAQRQVRMGSLISTLNMAGDVTRQPDTHVVYFDGNFPCQPNGTHIQGIANQSADFNLGNGVTAKHLFSSKPTNGYANYYEKMTTYASILSGPASVLKPGVSPRTFRMPEAEENSVFNYTETASDRAGIGALTERLSAEKVAIIGLGGTGSYVLDFVAKTPVREIRLFDGDEFLQHNAFRAPGAASIEELREAPKKVDHLKAIYSRMHRRIVAHAVLLDAGNIHLLDGVSFAFVCVDAGPSKRVIVGRLEALDVPFVDVGMGLELVDGSLGGILRVTASTPRKRDHVHKGRISFEGGGVDDLYSSNIQVADLNALNAALAVIKWKKLRGFYRDLEREHHSTYTTDGNMLLNSDCE